MLRVPGDREDGTPCGTVYIGYADRNGSGSCTDGYGSGHVRMCTRDFAYDLLYNRGHPQCYHRQQHKNKRLTGNSIILSTTLLVMVGLIFLRVRASLRDIFVGIRFSEPVYGDSFTLAFTIPDLVYNLLIGGSIQSAITPSLSASIGSGRGERGHKGCQHLYFFLRDTAHSCVFARNDLL